MLSYSQIENAAALLLFIVFIFSEDNAHFKKKMETEVPMVYLMCLFCNLSTIGLRIIKSTAF